MHNVQSTKFYYPRKSYTVFLLNNELTNPRESIKALCMINSHPIPYDTVTHWCCLSASATQSFILYIMQSLVITPSAKINNSIHEIRPTRLVDQDLFTQSLIKRILHDLSEKKLIIIDTLELLWCSARVSCKLHVATHQKSLLMEEIGLCSILLTIAGYLQFTKGNNLHYHNFFH